MPEVIEEGVLYVSMEYAIAIHKCVCGCNNEVVTPISPIDWELTFNGESISLNPSIGNWNFPCQSHYYITNNVIEYSRKWSKKEIAAGRKNATKKKMQFLSKRTKKKD